jgi:hypothetical protein
MFKMLAGLCLELLRNSHTMWKLLTLPKKKIFRLRGWGDFRLRIINGVFEF